MRTEAHGVTPVLISLSAFGASEVRRHGQLWFSELSLAAGADGVEVRSELLTDPERELPAIASALRAASKRAVYSSAEGLWRADGELDPRAVAGPGDLGFGGEADRGGLRQEGKQEREEKRDSRDEDRG